MPAAGQPSSIAVSPKPSRGRWAGTPSIGISDGAIAAMMESKADSDGADIGSALVLAPRHRRTNYVLRTARVTLGVAVTTFSAVSRALEGDSVAVPGTSASDRSIASLAPTAALGLAVGVAERGIDVATRVAAPPGRLLVRATNPLTRSLEPIAARILVSLHNKWTETAYEARAAAGEFGANLEQQIVEAALESIDLVAIVRERVDLNSLVDQVDIERIVQRIDPRSPTDRC